MQSSKINKFRAVVWGFYDQHKRNDLPWRNTSDPYHVLVSEMMLQQTQVSRVLEKYKTFIVRFPTFNALAQASLSDVLREWSGLGYNRRAKYLRQTAKITHKKYKNILPNDPNTLQGLPGIGPATAGAICAFAFNKPVVFIETNIRRAYIDFFYPNNDSVQDKELTKIIALTLEKDNPREWYWALMDYGSMLGRTIKNNPNRRSSTYIKQPRFNGSKREARARIIRFLLAKKSATLADIQSELGKLNYDLEEILIDLLNEHMLKKTGKRYSIPQ